MTCKNCMDCKKDKLGLFYCDIRYVTKNGKRLYNLPIEEKRKACGVFIKGITHV